ncbi:MAG: hypothetical protein HYZ00_01580, partial [Candidatus Hydrogenedentes bacterium]|nr:hypothetical protein [Candidatus Hydrogenedentota bacterium]
GNEISETFSDPLETGGDYYYVMVTQAGDNDGDSRGDEALASPIWFGTFQPRWGIAAFRMDWIFPMFRDAAGDLVTFLGALTVLYAFRLGSGRRRG